MKKAMSHTKVSVRLRKSELRDEWYLYLEAYPVFKAGREKPLREREYLNRIITTPMWDETRPARLNTNGEQSFKPSDKGKDLGDELADVLWVVLCLANQTGVDLTAALERNFDKKTNRDAFRHLNNEKLSK